MFLVFAGHTYYALGGWDDHIGTYNTFEEAKEAALRAMSMSPEGTYDLDWLHVVSLEKGNVVLKAVVKFNPIKYVDEVLWEELQ